MKTLLLFPVLLLSPLAWAQDKTATAVAGTANRQISLNLPKGHPTLVRDRRTVTLPTGSALLRFPDVPAGDALDKDSLQLTIDPAVSVLRQENSVLAAPNYGLASFVGKQVTLLRPQAEVGGTGKAVTGTLLSAALPTLLETADGVLVNPTGVWVLPREGKENLTESGFRGVQWQVNSSRAGDFPAEVNYASSKLSWDANYTAKLSATRDRLKLRGWLTFTNSTQTVFTDAKLSLRDGNDSPPPTVGTPFVWPRPATLGLGETRLAYVSADVPVTEQLIYETHNSGNFGQTVNQAHPLRSMALPNSADNGLGVYLPMGALSLWQGDDEKTLRLDKTASWGAFRPDSLISIPLGTNPDIYLSRYIVSSKLLNPVTREIVVSWKITSDVGPQAIAITEDIPDHYKLTSATLKPSSDSNGQLRFDVNVSVSKPVEFSYTIQVPA